MNKEQYSSFLKISQKLTILYVDDDKEITLKFKNLIERFFETFDIACDGLEALELYENFAYTHNKYYDVVITDIVMPRIDGVTLCKKFLEINSLQKIIVVSGHSEKKDLIELINIGIKRFIEKPFNVKEIFSHLESIVMEISINYTGYQYVLKENFIWNTLQKELHYNDILIPISYNETIILDLLIKNPYRIFSNAEIHNLLESENDGKKFSDNVAKTTIKRLREKLPFNIIKNIYAQGYKLDLI